MPLMTDSLFVTLEKLEFHLIRVFSTPQGGLNPKVNDLAELISKLRKFRDKIRVNNDRSQIFLELTSKDFSVLAEADPDGEIYQFYLESGKPQCIILTPKATLAVDDPRGYPHDELHIFYIECFRKNG